MISSVSAFATTPDDTYFKNSIRYTWSGASGQHTLSANTKLGDLVAEGINYISLDLVSLYSALNQIYNVANNGLGQISNNTANIADIETLLTELKQGWYWSDGTPANGYTSSWYYQVLRNLVTINNSTLGTYTNIQSILTELQNGLSISTNGDDNIEIITSNSSISSNALSQILTAVKRTNGKFFEYYTRGNFPNGNFNDVTIATSETYGAYHANGDGSYQFGSLSGVADRLEFLAWLHSDLLNVMGMVQTPNTIYKTEYVNSNNTTTSAISLSLQDSIVLGNRVITKNQADLYKSINNKTNNYILYLSRHDNNDPKQNITRNTYYPHRLPYIQQLNDNYTINTQYNSDNSLIDYLGVINTNLLGGFSFIETPYTTYHASYITGSAIIDEYKAYSLMDMLEGINYSVSNGLADLVYIIADPDTIEAKKANENQTSAVLDGFTGDGDASASSSDFGDIKDSVGSVKTGLNTNVSVSNILNIFNNNDGYGFWTDDTRQELNSTRSNRSNFKARGVSDTPLYDAKINELYNAMGVKHE